MAIQSFELDPAAGGVSQATFDAHTHNYRKITVIGVDDDDKYLSPDRMDIVDDAETVAATSVDAEAVGVTVATLPTTTPIGG